MLRFTLSHSAEAATNYFKTALVQEAGYYLDGKEIGSTWQGKTAEKLGLKDQPVTLDNFSALASNRHPDTGERLTVRDAANRRSGVDVTMSAPKSVSITEAITKDAAILEAHRAANHAAMLEIQADMQTQATAPDGSKYYEKVDNIAWASFEHYTSRPVKQDNDKYVSDCQLHQHNFVPNICWNEERQRYQAVELGNTVRNAPYYEAVFHSHLSFELQKAGYQIIRTRDRYEIAGADGRKLIEKFSGRTTEIEAISKEQNLSAKEKAELGAKTRVAKSKGIAEDQLHQIWKDRLSEEELRSIQNAKGLGAKDQGKPETDRISAKTAIDAALNHMLERQSAVPEKRVLAHALTLGYGQLRLDDVKQELALRDNILRAEKHGLDYITTKEKAQEERKLIEFAVKTKGTLPALHHNYQIKQEFLNDQQRKAVQDLLTSQDQVTLLRGGAGTGKSSLLTEYKNGVEENGKKLFALAPTSNATDALKSKGFEAQTLASLLVNQKDHDKLNNQVILCDEAGLIGTRSMLDLFRIAEERKARLVLSGDPHQHHAVERGDAMALLQEKARLQTAHVSKIVRQKREPYKKAIEQLSRGETAKGFKSLETMGAIKEIPDHEERMNALASDYINSLEQKRSALIVSPTHFEADTLSEIIRTRLKEKGRIKGEEKQFDTLRNLNLTEEQRKDNMNFQEGDVLRFKQNQPGNIKAGRPYKVVADPETGSMAIQSPETNEIHPIPHDRSDQFQLYSPTPLPLAVGDKIAITHNGKSLENTKVNNGSSYTVKGYTENGDIRLSNGKTLSKDYGHVKYGYVATSHASQGQTAKDVYLSQSSMSLGAGNEKQFYVSASRGSETLTIYTDDRDQLRKTVQRSGDRVSATEIAEKDRERRRREHQQQLYYQSQHKNQSKTPEYDRPRQQQPAPGFHRRGLDRD